MILPERDGKKFFEIALPLLKWVKKRERKSKTNLKRAWKNKYLDAKEAGVVWRAIWERPELIERYIKQKGDVLSEETKRALFDWRENFVFGSFIVARYLDEGAVFISVRDGQVYLVSGITSPIEESLTPEALPCQMKTALIPFMGRLIYDGIMNPEPVELAPEADEILGQIF